MAQVKIDTGMKSIDRFCEVHELSRSLVYRLIRDKKLRAVKIGGCTRITSHDEAEFIQSLPSMGVAA